jgi:hypothetical protein
MRLAARARNWHIFVYQLLDGFRCIFFIILPQDNKRKCAGSLALLGRIYYQSGLALPDVYFKNFAT